MTPLNPAFRRELRARAHHLQPVVIVGQHGLTAAVLHEIEVNLLAHELIKVRVFSDERAERDAMLERICAELGASPVQHIGKLLVLWRLAPEAPADAPAGPRTGGRRRPGAPLKEKTMAKSKPQARRPRTPMARGATSRTVTRKTSSAGRVPSAGAARRRRGGAA
jgi:putative YhbY family RNA-binding protein